MITRRLLLILTCLLLPLAAWGDARQSLDEIAKLIRLRDYSQAVLRLESLAKKGNAEAQYRLAGLYRNGKGVMKDLDQALDLYRASAQKGHAGAQFALALLIEKSGRAVQVECLIQVFYYTLAVAI